MGAFLFSGLWPLVFLPLALRFHRLGMLTDEGQRFFWRQLIGCDILVYGAGGVLWLFMPTVVSLANVAFLLGFGMGTLASFTPSSCPRPPG